MTADDLCSDTARRLCDWLATTEDVDAVEVEVSGWLAAFAQRRDAWYLIAAWLDAGGQLQLVERPMANWLRLFSETTDAPFVYKSWLDAGGTTDAVASPISAWLTIHSMDPAARFVYQAWLDGGGSLRSVERRLKLWMKCHALLPEARFVFQAWLGAGGSTDAVMTFVCRWLERHAASLEADYLLRAWLDSGGDFELVREAAFDWLHAHCEQEEAGFLAKQLSAHKRLPERTIRDIARWATCYPSHEDAVFRVSRISPTLIARHSISVETRHAVILAGHLVLATLLSSKPADWGTNPAATRRAVGILVQNLCRSSPSNHVLDIATRQITARVVASDDVFRPGRNLFVFPEMLDVVGEALRTGDLSYLRDRAGIESLGECLLSSDTRRSRPLISALTALEINHPHPLWRQCLRHLRPRKVKKDRQAATCAIEGPTGNRRDASHDADRMAR